MRIHGNAKIFSLYMDGQLDKKTADLLESHLKECSECREMLARFQETKRLISGAAKVKPPAELEGEIMDRLASKKYLFLSPFKRFSLAAGTVTVVLLSALLFLQRFKTEDIQIAMSPEQIKEIEETIKYRSAIEGKEGTVAKAPSEITIKPEAPSEREEERLLPDTDAGDRQNVKSALLKEQADEKQPEDKIPSEKQEEPLMEKKAIVAHRETGFKIQPAEKEISSSETTPEGIISLSYAHKDAPVPVVIRNENEWKTIWNTQNTAQNLSLPLPEVDFREKMVVALPSRTEDKEYIVVNTVEEKDKIIVEYKETLPQKSAPPPYHLNIVTQKPAVELQRVD